MQITINVNGTAEGIRLRHTGTAQPGLDPNSRSVAFELAARPNCLTLTSFPLALAATLAAAIAL
jgi:hypothetical protein